MSKSKYRDINFHNLFISNRPVIVFDDNVVIDGNSKLFSEIERHIFDSILDMINLYKDKRIIFSYDMSENWNKYKSQEVNYGDDYTGFSRDNIYVKNGVLSTNISKIKEHLYQIDNIYIQSIDIIKLENTGFFKDIHESMFANSFYIILEEKILIYGHMNGGFGFIDLIGNNSSLMKKLLRSFVNVEGLTWYANELGKDYIESNDIRINVS